MSNSAHNPLEIADNQINHAVSPNRPSAETEQHSFLKSLALHLLPGVPVALFYVVFAPLFVGWGFPPAFALCLAIPVVLIPLQLGILLYIGRRATGKFTLDGVVLYREKASIRQYIMYTLLIIVWSGLSFAILSKPIGGFIIERFFSWAPEWYVAGNSFTGSKPILLATWLMIMVFGNFLGPAVEELYFRGYLLPRMSRLKGWAPLLNATLFAAYHFWTPWEVITRTVAVLPLSFTAYKKQNVYIGLIAHVTLNTLSTLPLLALVFK